jgi:hypothetical protein
MRGLYGWSSAKEVEHDGDDSQDQQDVNEKCCDVENKEACEPGEHQHYRYCEKHLNPSLSGAIKANEGSVSSVPGFPGALSDRMAKGGKGLLAGTKPDPIVAQDPALCSEFTQLWLQRSLFWRPD